MKSSKQPNEVERELKEENVPKYKGISSHFISCHKCDDASDVASLFV